MFGKVRQDLIKVQTVVKVFSNNISLLFAKTNSMTAQSMEQIYYEGKLMYMAAE